MNPKELLDSWGNIDFDQLVCMNIALHWASKNARPLNLTASSARHGPQDIEVRGLERSVQPVDDLLPKAG